MLRNMNDNKIFNKYTLRILRLLFLHPYKEFYQREISKITGVSIGMTNTILSELEKYEIVIGKKKGKNKFYTYNPANPLSKHLKITLNILEIHPLVLSLRKYSEKIILFGSCATGEDTKESDIDLLVIAKEGYENDVKSLLRMFKPQSGRKVSAVLLNKKEYIEMKIKNKTFYQNVKKGIVMWDEREVE